MHVTLLAVALLERESLTHSAVLLNPYWFGQVREAQSLLYRAYSSVAQDHLDAPLPKEKKRKAGSRH